jgi:hypothetical protein
MNAEEFVKGLKIVLRDGAKEDFFRHFENLPGRKPHKKSAFISEGVKKLNEEEKKLLELIIDRNIDQTIFSFLCILDHVSFIEPEGEKTTFELYAVKNGERALINDPKNEELHDLYNSLVLEND